MGSASKVVPIRQKIVINVRECKQGELFFSFLIIFVKTYSYALEIFRNIDIKHLFNFKEYFYVFDTFYKCRLKAYNSTPRLKLISIKVQFMFICKRV